MKLLNCFRGFVFLVVMVLGTGIGMAQSNGQPTDLAVLTRTILHMDSLFWEAYNACDADKMGTFFTDDVEFYHDKGGLTTGNAALTESTRKGLCGNEHWRLRREAVAGTVQVFAMNNYGAILSGEHYFYINEQGKKERRDGLAKFTHVWRFKDNAWKMHRVLSYDHKPAPAVSTRHEVVLAPALLKVYAGKYESVQAGAITITPEGNTLKFTTEKIQTVIYPESEKLFFMKERDLQFEFAKEGNKVVKMIVYENGNKVEEAKRVW